LLLYALLLLRTAWLCDDSYITFRTVGNFVSGYGPVWNVAERVQAFTHPLWMLLISGLFCVTGGDINNSAMLGSIALSLAASLIYAFGIARTAWHAILGLTVLIFSKAFVDYSTSGLESPLSYLLVAWFLLLYMKDTPITARRLLPLSLLASLLVLNRMDLALIVGPALLHACWLSRRAGRAAQSAERSDSTPSSTTAIVPALDLLPTGQTRPADTPSRQRMSPPRGSSPILLVGVLLVGFLPILAWEVFSVIYYGFPFPNTAYAKLNTGIPAADLARQGLYYFANSLQIDPLTLPAIGCAVLAAIVSRRGRHLAIAAGIVLYLLYVVKIGGDFMSGRFFAVPLLAGLAILGTLDIRGWKAKAGWLLAMLATAGLGLSAANPSILTGSMNGHIGDGLVSRHGIADERGWYYIFTGLLRGNRKVGHVVLRDAENARKAGEEVVVTRNTIGMFGYYVGPDIHIVDLFALADPLLARLPVKSEPRWRIGHFEREIPDGYVESLKTGRNQIADPSLHDLYDRVLLATRGPLFSRQRWVAIWQLNVGGAAKAPSSQPTP
jgi:arabinofuranosyltransferase